MADHSGTCLFSFSTQFENLGDCVINECLLKEVARYQNVLVLGHRLPDWLASRVQQFGNVTVVRSRIRFASSVMQLLLSGRPVSSVFEPGHMVRRTSVAGQTRVLAVASLMSLLASLGCRVMGFGTSMDTYSPLERLAQSSLGKLHAAYGVRDSESLELALARGLMENKSSRMFYILRECGALARIMPEVDVLFGVPQPAQAHPEIDTGVHIMLAIDYAATRNYSLATRFATLTHDLGKGTTPPEEWPRHIGHEARSIQLTRDLCQRIRAPKDCRDLALLVARYHSDVHRAEELRPSTIADMLQAVDSYRKPQRFEEFLHACASDFHGRPGNVMKLYPQAGRLQNALTAARSVDAGAIALALR